MIDTDTKLYRYEKPDVTLMAATYEQVHSDLSEYRQLMAKNANIRFCKWAGQTENGKKEGDDAFPWPGASDLRFPLIDDHISANVATLVESERRSSLIGVPVEGSDVKRAKLVGNFMRWMIRSKMSELPHEVELAANYWEEKGGFVAGVFWDKRILEWVEKVDLEDIANTLMEQEIDPNLIFDPAWTMQFAQFLGQNYPDATEKEIDQAIEDIRNFKEAALRRVGNTVNRPCVRTFRKGEDIIYPQWVSDIQDSPYVFRVENKTPQQLLEYVETDGWDKKWVSTVIEKYMGTSVEDYADDIAELNRERLGLYTHTTGEEDDLVKVVWCYQRLINKRGVPGIYETIFCPEYTPEDEKGYAKHGLMDFRLKGRYPFWDFSRERISRNSFNSRGLPDNGGDFQKVIKNYYDGEIDRQSMTANPPFEYILGRMVPETGPGAQWPVMRRGEAGYAELPRYDPANRELREMLVDFSRNYAGLVTTPEYTDEARTKKQSNVNKWLQGWQEVYRMVFWLYQQYGDPMVTFRVMGSATTDPQVFHKNPTEDFDFILEFDVLSQEPELQQAKLKALGEAAVGADRNGRFNWDEYLILVSETIDPTWAERLIKPEDQAVQDEVKEELELIQKMWSGMDVDLPEQGINTQLRRQVLQSWMQGSENIPATDVQQRLQQDEAFKARIEKHWKQLDFVDQQRENAQTGRLGTPPSNIPAA